MIAYIILLGIGFLIGFFVGIQPQISRPAEAKVDELMQKWGRR
jgi:hypothetical protein